MRKAMTDAALIAWMETLKVRVAPAMYVVAIVFFPLGTLLFAKAMTPPGFDVGVRLVAGSLVFGLGLASVNLLAQLILFERFNNEMKLVIASPVHPLSYAAGVLIYSVGQALVTAAVVLSFAPLFGIDITLSIWLLPLLLLTALSMTGMAFVIATWSPSMEAGNMMANTLGILVVILSPVYYPIERLPGWLQWLVRFSPYTHAGEAMNRVLSGQGGFEREMLILAGITVVGLVIGILGLRWREA
jgi:ABC-type multidrug transport system permease subunit